MAKYNSRLDRRSKSKSNKVLNIMIAVVVLLIVVVGATILTGNGSDKENASTEVKDEDKNTNENSADRESEQKEDENTVSMDEESNSAESEDQDKKNEEEKEDVPEEKESVALDDSSAQIEEGSEPNVEKTIVHPDWEPVGTQQSGEHVSSYDMGTPDWQEKVKALSYATGIPEDNMTVWYIEGNGGPQKSIGTVTEKGGSTAYRVYLQWTDGQGWQPTKVEELVENDKD